MPIKTSIIPYLDDLSPEGRVTGAVNTIVKVPTPNGYKLVGTNTDILGVKNALLRTLRLQHPDVSISSQARYPASVKGAGIVIGGGATTRSAAHALDTFGLHPIYLINRDPDEVEAGKRRGLENQSTLCLIARLY
jgi:quinate dehydrogenase